MCGITPRLALRRGPREDNVGLTYSRVDEIAACFVECVQELECILFVHAAHELEQHR